MIIWLIGKHFSISWRVCGVVLLTIVHQQSTTKTSSLFMTILKDHLLIFLSSLLLILLSNDSFTLKKKMESIHSIFQSVWFQSKFNQFFSLVIYIVWLKDSRCSDDIAPLLICSFSSFIFYFWSFFSDHELVLFFTSAIK